jgi:hypothetical protein
VDYILALDEQRLAGQLGRSEDWPALELEFMPKPPPRTKQQYYDDNRLGRDYSDTPKPPKRRGLGKNPWWCGRPRRAPLP